ncbi:MAG: phage major capsid protein [Chloroflexi bacterium]|nr:phage major capsid protein [Chloroflexota bacterium]
MISVVPRSQNEYLDLNERYGLHDCRFEANCPRGGTDAERHRMIARRSELVAGLARIGEAAGDHKLTANQQRDYADAVDEFQRLCVRLGDMDPKAPLFDGATGDDVKGLADQLNHSMESTVRSFDTAMFGGGFDGTRHGSHDPLAIRPLKREDRLADRVRTGEPGAGVGFGPWLRAVVTGDWGGIDAETRAMSIGTPGAGGYLVPEPLSARIIDKARNNAAVMRAGATTIPMESNSLAIARVAGDPTAAWKVENAAATASDLTFERVDFTARTLVSIAKMSVELAEDAEVEDTTEDALSAALSLELDRAALRGSGTAPEPRGVRNQTGVTIQSQGVNGAALTNYDPLSTAVQTIRENNQEPNAYIAAPRTIGALDRLKDTTNQPLRPPPSVEDLRAYSSAQVPINLTHGTATTASEIYVADWSDLLIGVRRQITVEVSRQAADGTEGAFTNLQVWVRAYLRADVQLAQPKAFAVITGVL